MPECHGYYQSYIDAAAIGRLNLADPERANKAKAGRDEDTHPCIGCENSCISRYLPAPCDLRHQSPTAL